MFAEWLALTNWSTYVESAFFPTRDDWFALLRFGQQYRIPDFPDPSYLGIKTGIVYVFPLFKLLLGL